MKTSLLRMLSLTFLPAASCLQAGESTIDPARSFAWSGNAGFINWRPGQPSAGSGAVVHEWFLEGKIYAANFGWIDLGDGSPANGLHYQNNSASDCGVNVLPAGGLEGCAWCGNIGWIVFEQTYGKPHIDYASGYLLGYAWSPNIGWVTLGEENSSIEFKKPLRANTILCTDTDGDTIGDEYEMIHFGNLSTAGPGTDFDKDGSTDAAEYTANTDPKDRSSYLRFLDFKPIPPYLYGSFTSAPGRGYRIEGSTDLINWTDLVPGVPALVPTNFPTQELLLPMINPQRQFYRLRAVRPLAP